MTTKASLTISYLFLALLLPAALNTHAQQQGIMNDFSVRELFRLKVRLETQLQNEFVQGPSAETIGAFDFLIGEWNLVRTSFDEAGNVLTKVRGTVSARYVLGGRAIQEDFYNYGNDGTAFRGGTAVYTFRPSTQQWHVAAVDASTGATSYQPRFVNGDVHYESSIHLPQATVYTKNRIFNISNDSTEWQQMISTDGENWYVNYHILNTRKK